MNDRILVLNPPVIGGRSPGIQYFTELILYPIASLAISITAEALEDRWK
jgi:hypothetical protein